MLSSRLVVTTAFCGLALAVCTGPSFAGGSLEEVQTQSFQFPLAPGGTMLSFDQFDDQAGTRVLQKVTLMVEGTIQAMVTAENDSVLPAPDFALNISGFMTIDFRDLSTFMGYDATFLTDGSVGRSDGVPGSGPDFWDFGLVSDSETAMDMTSTDLGFFIGGGTIPANVFATGGFSLSGSTDSTIVTTMFMALGTVDIIYQYREIPTGACCFTDGECSVLTEEQCVEAGGIYQGDGTTCDPNPCRGACCLPNGDCIEVTQLECEGGAALTGALGTTTRGPAGPGVYQGDGTTCATVECPQPGACCLPDGSCFITVDVSGETCLRAGGEYQGPDTDCVGVACPDPEGACCLEDGSCVSLTQIACGDAGGLYQGDFTSCDAVSCPVTKGACCYEDGSCAALTVEECAATGGSYQGDDTNCLTAACPQPVGACCFDDGSCVELTQFDCVDGGYLYQGDGTSCATTECPDLKGACCFDDGSCSFETISDCIVAGGSYQGDDVTCEAAACPQPAGACC
ncbi:MAG: choice-of-anchor E domain-containing protein, partial [Phycisphaerales bacterium]|nr:choice-of-anchor E domain-containing protein [Phycisphaerales bacterium]